MKDFIFHTELQVRDYECDLQGIVNNAVYQNYLEHCRHLFLRSAGLDFNKLHNEGIDAVVIKAEVEYKNSLYPGDEFIIQLKIGRKGHLRIIFDQHIVRKSDNKLIVKARIMTALVQNGRPVPLEVLADKFQEAGIIIPEVS
ncbi:MAG: thioesterase family protein [Prolixibacteraceae bacterium]|nr:thioesterase family protein [Prolixibacteraceae bacterium]